MLLEFFKTCMSDSPKVTQFWNIRHKLDNMLQGRSDISKQGTATFGCNTIYNTPSVSIYLYGFNLTWSLKKQRDF